MLAIGAFSWYNIIINSGGGGKAVLDMSKPQNTLSVFLAGLGFLQVLLTYGAYFASKRSDHNVSGVPIFGGLFILVGFLISTNKWLAFFALLDPGFIGFPYSVISYSRRRKKYTKEFLTFMQGHSLTCNKDNKPFEVHITTPKDKDLIFSCAEGSPYFLFYPKLAYAFCEDSDGKKILLVNRCKKGSETEALPFDSGEAVIEELILNKGSVNVTIKEAKGKKI